MWVHGNCSRSFASENTPRGETDQGGSASEIEALATDPPVAGAGATASVRSSDAADESGYRPMPADVGL